MPKIISKQSIMSQLYTTSFRNHFISCKQKQGLILEISDKADHDSQGNSMIRPGDDPGSGSSKD